MYFNVASNFYDDFLNLLRKLSCEKIYLLYSNFMKLLERFIEVLAAILALEVLQVSLRSSSNFESKYSSDIFKNNKRQISQSKQQRILKNDKSESFSDFYLVYKYVCLKIMR